MSGYGSPPPGGNFYPRELLIQILRRDKLTYSSTPREGRIWCATFALTMAQHDTDTNQTSKANSSTLRLRQAVNRILRLLRLPQPKASSNSLSTTPHHRVASNNTMRRLPTIHSSNISLRQAARLLSISLNLSNSSTSRLSSCSLRKVP